MKMRVKYTAGQKVAQYVGLGVLGSGVCGGLLLYRQDERFYTSLSSLLHKCLGGESAQRLAVKALSHGFYFRTKQSDQPDLSVSLWGLHFHNPVGVAAGFDKHGEAVTGLTHIGFGFVEVGSVTPQPQEGNLNSDGHLQVRKRLELLRAGGFNGILGINLGKNQSSTSAVEDFVAGVRQFSHLADYLVINVSGLQQSQNLKTLIQSVLAARRDLQLSRAPPLLVKISPELSDQELQDIAEVVSAPDSRVEGLVISNTSTATISRMFSLTGGRVPIVGVGGVRSGKEAWEKVLAGASLVQVYTGLVHHGPPLVSRVRRELGQLLEEGGFSNIQEAVGADHTRRK